MATVGHHHVSHQSAAPMIVRSDPQADATQFCHYLMGSNPMKCREVFFGVPISQFFGPHEIAVHGTTFLELVLRKIAVFNAGLVSSFAVDWIHMHPEDVHTVARAGVKPQDLFSEPMIAHHGVVFLTEVMKHMRGALQRTHDWEQKEHTRVQEKAPWRASKKGKENVIISGSRVTVNPQVTKSGKCPGLNEKKQSQFSAGPPGI